MYMGGPPPSPPPPMAPFVYLYLKEIVPGMFHVVRPKRLLLFEFGHERGLLWFVRPSANAATRVQCHLRPRCGGLRIVCACVM